MHVRALVKLYGHRLVGADLSYLSPVFEREIRVHVVALTDNESVRVNMFDLKYAYNLAPMQRVELLTLPEIARTAKNTYVQLSWERRVSRETSRRNRG